LLAAALIAAIVIGYAIWQSRSSSPEIAAQNAGTDPMSIEALEKRTQASPNDPAAWASLGIAYFSEGRFDDAARAYDRASTLDSGKAVLWAALGEARVMASKTDPMPPAAVTAFEKAIALDPEDPRARYFLAVKKDLAGNHEGAIGDWLALLADTPADAPWRADLIRTIEQVGKINKLDVAPRIAEAERKSPPAVQPMAARAIPGPSADDLRNAGSIPPSEQKAMAQGMVSRLEARLKGDPRNVDGWIMLIRSRVTLGEADKAAAALKTAVAANPDRAAEIRQQAEMLGVR
jgi:cytochrome c-type biogenesis protein CcmH